MGSRKEQRSCWPDDFPNEVADVAFEMATREITHSYKINKMMNSRLSTSTRDVFPPSYSKNISPAQILKRAETFTNSIYLIYKPHRQL